jgi:hypothetical protein
MTLNEETIIYISFFSKKNIRLCKNTYNLLKFKCKELRHEKCVL